MVVGESWLEEEQEGPFMNGERASINSLLLLHISIVAAIFVLSVGDEILFIFIFFEESNKKSKANLFA